MSRIALKKGQQREFLYKAASKSGLKWVDIAHICNVSERTIRDWRREKFYMNYEAAQSLAKKTFTKLSLPKAVLPDYWSTKKAAPLGAKIRYQIYGNPGTEAGRRKGGIRSQEVFNKDPYYAEKLGIQLRKTIKEPNNSPALSEFIGILLGDGGLSNYQATVTLNKETDIEYCSYIQQLIIKLFNISSSFTTRTSNSEKTAIITISSKNLVEFLVKKGLKIGNKIYNKVDIPGWIKNNNEYKIACLRGLVDTDGSFYCYKHTINKKIYANFAICFANKSKQLLRSTYRILQDLKLKPSQGQCRIYLYRKKDIEEYCNIVGSSNSKHIKKYKAYLNGEVRKRS